MIIVHVQHYLTEAGIKYFLDNWFSEGCHLLKQQKGFRSVKYSRDPDDNMCINLWLEFDTLENLKQWGNSEKHHNLVSSLDIYRPKPYYAKRYLIEKIFEGN